MLPRQCADLPPLFGVVSEAAGEEVLAKQPAKTGGHWWIRVRKDGLGTQQVREALARSVQRPAEVVSDAGNRDRKGVFTQWFSIPADAIDHPGPLRRAGAHNKMRVLEIVAAHKPFTEAAVERIRWRLRIQGGAQENGYLKAKALMDRLRHAGLPNYVGSERLGPEGSLARLGRSLAQGERLPPHVMAKSDPGRCLRAFQESAFNHFVAARMRDGLLGSALEGDLLRSRQGQEVLVDDPVAAQKRLDTWEAVPLGPMPGMGFLPLAGAAGARELAWLADQGLTMGMLERLRPAERRALRNQPAKVQIDPEGADVVISCELPADVYVSVLVDELMESRSGA